jgi:hypothetical protein
LVVVRLGKYLSIVAGKVFQFFKKPLSHCFCLKMAYELSLQNNNYPFRQLSPKTSVTMSLSIWFS